MLSDIRSIDQEQLKSFLKQHNQQAFRVKQILEWLWKKAVYSFEDMTNLSLDLRKLLAENFEIRGIQTDKIQRSQDGTLKFRFRLYDGHLIESVLIPVPEDERYTVCVSSQVGCSLTCSFCATGKMKRIRNLDAAEIFDQVVLVSRECEKVYGRPITNVVYMGMGEPLDNFDNFVKAVEIFSELDGLAISRRRQTVSTSGIASKIKKLGEKDLQIQLAISLHAVDDELRSELIPMNKAYNIASIIEAVKEFPVDTRKKVMFEYLVIKDKNDSLAAAKKLVKLLDGIQSKVNLIYFNPYPGTSYQRPLEEDMLRFKDFLNSKGVICTIRESKGLDISAACGQLKEKELNGNS